MQDKTEADLAVITHHQRAGYLRGKKSAAVRAAAAALNPATPPGTKKRFKPGRNTPLKSTPRSYQKNPSPLTKE